LFPDWFSGAAPQLQMSATNNAQIIRSDFAILLFPNIIEPASHGVFFPRIAHRCSGRS